MTIVQLQKSIVVHCATCGHYKSRHGPEGCVICAWEIMKGWRKTQICRERFVLRLSLRDAEQARAFPKNSYRGSQVCATCFEIWLSHDGLLCPNLETLFVPLIGEGNA